MDVLKSSKQSEEAEELFKGRTPLTKSKDLDTILQQHALSMNSSQEAINRHDSEVKERIAGTYGQDTTDQEARLHQNESTEVGTFPDQSTSLMDNQNALMATRTNLTNIESEGDRR